MNYQEKKEQLAKLESTLEKFNFAKNLTDEQLKIREALIDGITELRREIPINWPVSLQSFNGRSSSGPFPTLGEQLKAVRQAGIPGGQIDNRLYNVRAAASGLNETVPSEGGFLLQPDYSKELIDSVYQTGVLAQRCRRIPISANSNSLKINGIDETTRATGSRYGGVQGYWLDEAGTFTPSKPKFRQMNLVLKKLIGLCYATDELMDDAAALQNVIQTAFVKEFGFLLDDGIINGTGAGQLLGILNSGSLVTVNKEAGQKAAVILAENIINMYSRLLPGSDATAAWLVNKNTLPQLYTMSISVGTGGVPIFMPANGVSGLPYNTLFGRPVIPIEQAATLGTVGDIILADLENGYILAEKGGIEAEMSIHVRFLYDENVFRFVMRVDGMPALASAITPYKGSSATQSHFIVLQSRT